MQSLEAACEDGERSIKRMKTSRSSLPLLRHQEPSTSSSASSSSQEILENPSGKPPFDIFSKLLELHEEFKESDEYTGSTRYKTLLLEKLVARERLNTLIIKLYPGNKGYSFAFRPSSRSSSTDSNSFTEDNTANLIETKLWPYEMGDFLQYIDNEELPAFIVDKLESQFSYLFYNGCVIAEVRDYRQAYPHTKCDIRHVLLRPTLTSILADINNIVKKETSDWTSDEKDQLESQLLMANAPSLCLEPDRSAYRQLMELNNRKRIWNTHKLRRMAKKCSQVAVNRKKKMDQFTHKKGLELFDFITRTRNKQDEGSNKLMSPTMKVSRKISEEIEPVPVPSLEPPMLSPPRGGVDIKEFKIYQRPKETSDCLPQLIEEYVLETDMPSKDKDKPRVYYIKLSILQRPSNSEFLGELYLDRDYKKDHKNGVACRFPLGSRANALRYIHQFTDIFTESGRKPVTIRKYSLNAAAYKEREASVQAQAALAAQELAQQQLAQQKLAQQQLAQQQLAQQQLAQQQLLSQQNAVNVQQQKQVLKTQKSVSPPVVNGSIPGNIRLQAHLQTQTNLPVLQSHLQGSTRTKDSEQISALAKILENSSQQFEAENAKQLQQQQQQKLASSNPAMINLLTSSTASNINSEASAAAVNAINNAAVNQKFFARKMTIPNVANARLLNHTNLIALNARLQEQPGQQQPQQIQQVQQQLQQIQQPQQTQTITLASGNSANFTNFTPKRVVATSSESASNQTALSALLVGTPAADRPDIVGQNNNTLFLEKFSGSSNSKNPTATAPNAGLSTRHQFMLQQSPKANAILSPLSSPPPPNANVNVTNTTVNVGLNFAQLQSIQGLQVLTQPFSVLNVSSAGNIQGHPNLIVTLPVTSATQTSNAVVSSQAVGSVNVNNISVTPQTVVLANTGASNIAELLSAQLMTSSVKGVSQQGLRSTTSPQSVSLPTQSGQPYQLMPLQRPRTIQQQPTSPQEQQTLGRTARNHQRTTPITIKMAATAGTPNANASTSQVNMSTLTSQLQNQPQLHQFQQLRLSQANVLNKLRRTNAASSSDQQ